MASRLVTPSLEARTPLLVAEADGKADNLPSEQVGIAVSEKSIQVTAFRHNRVDNPVFAGTAAINAGSPSPKAILRLWEQGGPLGNVTVTLPKGKAAVYTKATPVNLRGEITGKTRKSNWQ